MAKRKKGSMLARLVDAVIVGGGAMALTLTFFFVLPLIQAISKSPTADRILQTVDTAALEPPPPPPEEEQKDEEPEPEEQPPELDEDVQPLDLSQLELALGAGIGGTGFLGGDFAVKLDKVVASSDGGDGLFSIADLDQKPRPIYRVNPTMTPAMRRKAPATVQIVFVVDQSGRVEDPTVQQSPTATDPEFERAALAAVRKWKFEPGKRSGQPVRFRMRVPITFPKS